MGVGKAGHGHGGGAPALPPGQQKKIDPAQEPQDGPGNNGQGNAFGHQKKELAAQEQQAQIEAQQRAQQEALLAAQQAEQAQQAAIQEQQRVAEEQATRAAQVAEQEDVAAWRERQDRFEREAVRGDELVRARATLKESSPELTIADREKIRAERDEQLVKQGNLRDVPDHLLPRVDLQRFNAGEQLAPAQVPSIPRVVAPQRDRAEETLADASACPIDRKEAVRNGVTSTQFLFRKLHDSIS